MGIKAKDVLEIKARKLTEDFNENEIDYIDRVEDFIDSEIINQYNEERVVIIPLNIINLGSGVYGGNLVKILEYRKPKISTAIELIYDNLGWKITKVYDDMGSGIGDVVILRPKEDE